WLSMFATNTEAPTATKPPWMLPLTPRNLRFSLAFTLTLPFVWMTAPLLIAATVPSGRFVSPTAPVAGELGELATIDDFASDLPQAIRSDGVWPVVHVPVSPRTFW